MLRSFFAVSIVILLTACGGDKPEASPETATLSTSVMSSSHAQGSVNSRAIEKFSGIRSEYTLSMMNGVATVTSKLNGDITELSTATQRIQFADGTLVIDIDGYPGTVYRVYQAAFDRKPDIPGYAFWLKAADADVSIEDIAAGFVDSGEFRRLYGTNPSNHDLLTRYYQNVLHRAPDPAGFDFWMRALNGGTVNFAQLLAHFSDSQENKAQVLPDIENGIWVPGDGKLKVSLLSGNSISSTGKVEAINIDGVSAIGAQVSVDGVPIPSISIDGNLFFTVPELKSGTSIFSVTTSGQTSSIPLTIRETLITQAPLAYLDTFFSALDRQLLTALSSAPMEKRPQLEQLRKELTKQSLSLSSMPEAELRKKAVLIMANFGYEPEGSMSAIRAAELNVGCANAAAQAGLLNLRVAAAAGILAIGVATLDPILIVPAGIAFALVWEPAVTRASAAYENCVSTVVGSLNPQQDQVASTTLNSASRANVAMAAPNDLSFANGKTRFFHIVEITSVHPAAFGVRNFMRSIGGILDRLQTSARLFGIDLSNDVAYAKTYGNDRKAIANPVKYKLGGLSDARIAGSAAYLPTAISLTFSLQNDSAVTYPLKFNFSLVNATTGQIATNVGASLDGAAPSIQGQSIIAHPGVAVTSRLVASNAVSFSITTPPQQGQASINADTGEFRYTATPGTLANQDTFTVVATNAYGKSAPAFVGIKITPLPQAPVGSYSGTLTWSCGYYREQRFSVPIVFSLQQRATQILGTALAGGEEAPITYGVRTETAYRDQYGYLVADGPKADGEYIVIGFTLNKLPNGFFLLTGRFSSDLSMIDLEAPQGACEGYYAPDGPRVVFTVKRNS